MLISSSFARWLYQNSKMRSSCWHCWAFPPGLQFGKGVKNLIAPVGSSVDLDCAGHDILRPMLSLQLVSVDGHSMTLTPDGKKVIQTERVFTINNLDPDMRGSVQCKVASSCSRKANFVDIGYLLPVPNTSKRKSHLITTLAPINMLFWRRVT